MVSFYALHNPEKLKYWGQVVTCTALIDEVVDV